MEDILMEVEEALRNGVPEDREEIIDLLGLACRIKGASFEVDELVDLFVDWLMLCEDDLFPILKLISRMRDGSNGMF